MTVDGTHCSIQEPRKEPNSKWYSHKLNGPGVAYEVGLCTRQSKIIWTYGPFQAGDSDLTIYRTNGGLREQMARVQGMMAVADRGYGGEGLLSIPNELDSGPGVKQFKRRACAQHESLNGRLKNFAVLSETFRHPNPLVSHGIAFDAVCVILQYSMEGDSPLFAI